MIAMTALIPCMWNPAKVWVVTRSKNGEYRTNQLIHGRLFYKKFTKTSKYSVSEATCKTYAELNAIFSGV
jgi:hypothetical protein